MGETSLVIVCAVGLALLFNIAISLSQIAKNAGPRPPEIQVVAAGQNDLLIFRASVPLNAEMREALRDVLAKACPGRKVFVVEKGLHLEAVIQAPQVVESAKA